MQPIAREQLRPVNSQDEVITEIKDKNFSLVYEKLMPCASVPLQQRQMGTAKSLFPHPLMSTCSRGVHIRAFLKDVISVVNLIFLRESKIASESKTASQSMLVKELTNMNRNLGNWLFLTDLWWAWKDWVPAMGSCRVPAAVRLPLVGVKWWQILLLIQRRKRAKFKAEQSFRKIPNQLQLSNPGHSPDISRGLKGTSDFFYAKAKCDQCSHSGICFLQNSMLSNASRTLVSVSPEKISELRSKTRIWGNCVSKYLKFKQWEVH